MPRALPLTTSKWLLKPDTLSVTPAAFYPGSITQLPWGKGTEAKLHLLLLPFLQALHAVEAEVTHAKSSASYYQQVAAEAAESLAEAKAALAAAEEALAEARQSVQSQQQQKQSMQLSGPGSYAEGQYAMGGRGAAAELEKKCEGLSLQLKRLQVRGGGRGYWEGVWVGMPSTGDM